MNKRSVGAYWEGRVTEYLRMQGYTILYRNYRTRYSEIDIIAQDRKELTFIEVKYRKDNSAGDPLEAVTYSKQNKIYNAARFFLKENGYDVENTCIRFDVIGILGDKITHIENACMYVGWDV